MFSKAIRPLAPLMRSFSTMHPGQQFFLPLGISQSMIVGPGNIGSAVATEIRASYRGCLIEGVCAPGESTAATSPYDRIIDDPAKVKGKTSNLVMILSVKPQVWHLLAAMYGERFADSFVISVMAGIHISSLREAGFRGAILRTMPNTPIRIGYGVTFACADGLTSHQLQFTESVFSNQNNTLFWIPESLMHAATATSGSGPAYYYLLMEQLLKVLQQDGLLDNPTARQIMLEKFEAAYAYLCRVTSANLLTPFLGSHNARCFNNAVHAAAHRSQELAGEIETTSQTKSKSSLPNEPLISTMNDFEKAFFACCAGHLQGAIELGLDPAIASQAILATIKGAIELTKTSGEHPKALRDAVTSQGGTTAAALDVLLKTPAPASIEQQTQSVACSH